jgi:hypothetical protein
MKPSVWAILVESPYAHTLQRPHHHPERHQDDILSDKTILQIASRNCIQIPNLCNDPRPPISGHRKVCLVEVEGKPKASCREGCRGGENAYGHRSQLQDRGPLCSRY